MIAEKRKLFFSFLVFSIEFVTCRGQKQQHSTSALLEIFSKFRSGSKVCWCQGLFGGTDMCKLLP